MQIDQLRDYCIRKKGVTEHFPFDDVTLVFKVMGKMFALVGLNHWEQGETKINLKCDPDWAEELRGSYDGIQPGWHMSKTHWNTVTLNEDVSDAFAFELIDHSYEQVIAGLPKKVQEQWRSL